MTQTMIFYKVLDNQKGRFMTAGGGWARTGKTWESLGRLRNALNSAGYYAEHDGSYSLDLPVNCEIIEVVVRHDEGNRIPLGSFVERERRFRDLAKTYGHSFSTLVRRIEDQGQENQFQWVLAATSQWNWKTQEKTGPLAEMLEIIKTLKLKQNKDYKKATESSSGGFIAFSTKEQAMRVKLMMSGPTKGIDIKEFIELDLDNAGQEVNSSC